MKKSIKETMVELVKMVATEKEGIFQVERSKVEELFTAVEALGKFTVKNNKKDETLKAIAYTTKKSENLVVIQIVEDAVEEVKEVVSKKAQNVTAKIKTEMLKDAGETYHKCLVQARVFKKLQEDKGLSLDDFLEIANKIIESDELLESGLFEGETKITIEDDIIIFENVICLPKIPHHSKDGYAKYKSCLAKAKKEFKEAM